MSRERVGITVNGLKICLTICQCRLSKMCLRDRFNDRVSAGVTIAIGSLIYLLIAILFAKVLLIGLYRYLLEIRVYTGTRISRILVPWSIKKALHIAWVMFVRSVYSLLCCLTIVGGFIKIYSYKLVPMIIAENPELSAKEAIKLSEDMMKGYKWRAFLIDLSFIGWDILNILTLQILGVFFLEHYKRCLLYTSRCV